MTASPLNEGSTSEVQVRDVMGDLAWTIVSEQDLALERTTKDVFLEKRLAAVIRRLNPKFVNPDVAVVSLINELRALCYNVPNGLVSANEEFTRFLTGGVSRPFGVNGRHVTVRLIDFDDITNNDWVTSNQVTFEGRLKKRFDNVGYVNGLPLVVGEAKSPVAGEKVSWVDGARDFAGSTAKSTKIPYEESAAPFLVPSLFEFAYDGKELGMAGVGTPVEEWMPWLPMENGRPAGIGDGRRALEALLAPRMVLDLARHFTLFGSREGRRYKVVARYQQVDAVRAIEARVMEGHASTHLLIPPTGKLVAHPSPRQGLIWHFQGSGKSLLMLFAARLLRANPALKNPPILVVVDRNELDTQISGVFRVHEIAGFAEVKSGKDLAKKLADGTKEILVTTIQKFGEIRGLLNDSSEIIALVDEAHRSQEGDFGEHMREALPNAFLFGLTGTPINKVDRNTFKTFGAIEDASGGGYLSKYSLSDAVRDKATVPLRFEHREAKLRIDQAKIDEDFATLASALSENAKAELSKRAAGYLTIAEDPDRIKAVAANMAQHFTEHVAVRGFKAMVVAPSRKACVLYKEALDQHLPTEISTVVMSMPDTDPKSWLDRFRREPAVETKLLNDYRKHGTNPQILIVTARLLTGFDARILQTIYLDKPMRDHTLLQAICRTNRPYTNSETGERKQFGLIVDYVGAFDDVGSAFAFDEDEIKSVISDLANMRKDIAPAIAECSQMLEGIDRTLSGYAVLEAADRSLSDPKIRDEFAQRFVRAARMWEALFPDPQLLNPLKEEYSWLAKIYASLRASTGASELVWERYGARTVELIQSGVDVERMIDDFEAIVVDAETLENLPPEVFANGKALERYLSRRISLLRHDPRFIPLGIRLERLKERLEQGMIDSVSFLKALLALARDVVEAEQESGISQRDLPASQRKAALTDLFNAVEGEKISPVVGRIVDRIDEVVIAITGGFEGWQETASGTRKVHKAVLRILLDFQLHTDEELKSRVYEYIQANY